MGRVYNYAFLNQSMSWTWLMALVFGQIIYNNKLTSRFKVLLIVLAMSTFYVTAYQAFDWKSGWVPPLIAILALIGFRYRKFVVFLIPIAVVIALYFSFELILTDEYSWGTRTDAWRIILEISRVSPLFGMGFSNYYWYTPLFPIRGWNVNFNSHSQYIDLIAQTGYLGLIGFLWIFFEIGRLSFNLMSRLRDGFARAYASAVFAGVIATLFAAYLGDWVLPFVYNVGLPGFRASVLPWIFMGGIMALEQIYIHTPQKLESDLS
jgi:O-antigen ligase